MTNKEICTKAVAAYHVANPNITVDEWECAADQEGVAILTIAGRKVYIRYSETDGYEMMKHYAAPQKTETVQAKPIKPAIPVPGYVKWKDLPDNGTGTLPAFLDVLSLICALIAFFGLFFMWVLIPAGIVSAITLHISASIIRSIRSTEAYTAHTAALLEYIAKKE